MKVLITGGLGHIGSYFLKRVTEFSNIDKIYIIDNFLSERYSSLFNIPIKKKNNLYKK